MLASEWFWLYADATGVGGEAVGSFGAEVEEDDEEVGWCCCCCATAAATRAAAVGWLASGLMRGLEVAREAVGVVEVEVEEEEMMVGLRTVSGGCMDPRALAAVTGAGEGRLDGVGEGVGRIFTALVAGTVMAVVVLT